MIGVFLHPQSYVAVLSVPIFLSSRFGFKESFYQFFKLRPMLPEYKQAALNTLGFVSIVFASMGMAITFGSIGEGPEAMGGKLAILIGGLGILGMTSLWISCGSQSVLKVEEKSSGGVEMLTIVLLSILSITFLVLWIISLSNGV